MPALADAHSHNSWLDSSPQPHCGQAAPCAQKPPPSAQRRVHCARLHHATAARRLAPAHSPLRARGAVAAGLELPTPRHRAHWARLRRAMAARRLAPAPRPPREPSERLRLRACAPSRTCGGQAELSRVERDEAAGALAAHPCLLELQHVGTLRSTHKPGSQLCN